MESLGFWRFWLFRVWGLLLKLRSHLCHNVVGRASRAVERVWTLLVLRVSGLGVQVAMLLVVKGFSD